jgi:hypothetical protein
LRVLALGAGILCAAGLGLGGTVVTLDGRVLEGALAFKEGPAIVVTPPGDGAPVSLALADVREISPVDVVEGLTGEYFAAPDLTDRRFTRIDSRIDFDWPDGICAPDMPVKFSARWTGYLVPRYTEEYTFHTTVDDGMRLWIDEQQVIEHWTRPLGDDTAKIALTAGRLYRVRLEYTNSGGFRGTMRWRWSSAHQADEPVPPACFRTPSPEKRRAQGLKGEYFQGQNFEKRIVVRADAQVDFDWTLKAPDPQMMREHFSARWTGFLIPPETADYTITLRSDDGSSLWLEDKLLVDNQGNHPVQDKSASIHLEAGRSYPLRLEYYQDMGAAQMQLLWATGGGAAEAKPQVVPMDCLGLPADFRRDDSASAAASRIAGVVLIDGSFLAGRAGMLDDKQLTLVGPGNSKLRIAREKVARILLRGLSAEMAARIKDTDQGLLNNDGEFVACQVASLDDHQVQASTVALGLEGYELNTVAALVMQPIKPTAGAYQIITTDGSEHHTRELQFKAGALVFNTDCLGELSLKPEQIRQILHAAGPGGASAGRPAGAPGPG